MNIIILSSVFLFGDTQKKINKIEMINVMERKLNWKPK